MVAQNSASWNRLAHWLRGVSAAGRNEPHPDCSLETGPLEVD
jgi:hypothetical protein